MEEKIITGLVELIMKEILNCELHHLSDASIERRKDKIARFVGENFGEGADHFKLAQDIDIKVGSRVWHECKTHMIRKSETAETYYLQSTDKDYAVQGHTPSKTLQRKAQAYGRKCGLTDFKRVLPIATYKYVSDFLYDYYRNECKMF